VNLKVFPHKLHTAQANKVVNLTSLSLISFSQEYAEGVGQGKIFTSSKKQGNDASQGFTERVS
jgi:hypothetical protein